MEISLLAMAQPLLMILCLFAVKQQENFKAKSGQEGAGKDSFSLNDQSLLWGNTDDDY